VQELQGVLTKSFDELLVLHLILVVEGEEGLSAGVRRVPEL
jgi:DNA-binding cell septation regulator SpoVG